MKVKKGYNEGDVNKAFEKIPKVLYKFEPFEFYGGNFNASLTDKQGIMRDDIYRKQEVEILKLKEHIEILT